MAVHFDDYLVVAVSSRALFNLEVEHNIFKTQGLDAYRQYQWDHETDLLTPGAGFSLIKKLLALNTKDKRLVEVIVMSRNSAETSIRLLQSIEHYGLDINRVAFTGGMSIAPYLSSFGVHLFLSCFDEDVIAAEKANFPAARIYAHEDYGQKLDQIRIAFDADAVLFSDASEQIYQTKGLPAFVENEIKYRDIALEAGPMASFLFRLDWLKKQLTDPTQIRTAIVSARDKAAGLRVLKTLKQWQLAVDEVFFLQGAKKASILDSFCADLFFDDQEVHAKPASEWVPSARVSPTNQEEQ